MLAAQRRVLRNRRDKLISPGHSPTWITQKTGKKKLPEGWLLSTSGSAPRLKSRNFVVRADESRRCVAQLTARGEYTDADARLSIQQGSGQKIYSMAVKLVLADSYDTSS